MTFADLNNDKYTDVISILEDKKNVMLFHFFDTSFSMFRIKKNYTLSSCSEITNIVVGKS